MARYIDAEIAIEKCDKLINGAGTCPNPYATEGIEVVRNLILSECKTGVPTANVVEVKHGEWKRRGQEIYCSVCGNESAYNPFGASKFSDYCPNCGADMRGDEK